MGVPRGWSTDALIPAAATLHPETNPTVTLPTRYPGVMRLAFPMLAVLLTVSSGISAQIDGELVVFHSFPLAGEELAVVVECPAPGAPLVIELEMADKAPPSVQEHLASGIYGEASSQGNILTVVYPADDSGLFELRIPLDDPDDAGRLVALSFWAPGFAMRGEVSLLVQPPSVMVPTASGLQRIDLRDGTVVPPALPGTVPVRGLSFSADGRLGYVLRQGGALEVRSAEAWDRRPSVVYSLDPHGDSLAHGTASGPAFVIVRPIEPGFGGLPSAGRVQFLDDRYDDLTLEPLGRPVAGRRWAVTDDGLTAFVAEDDLLVREIDLITGTARMPFTAGFNGDLTVADVALQGSRLLVLTRRAEGLPGALTVYDLSTGWVRPQPLTVDPLRIVVLDDEVALVVPARGGELTRVDQGVPGRIDRSPVPLADLLDAAPVQRGALVLARRADQSRLLLTWDDANGLRFQSVTASLQDSHRLVAAGLDVAVLLEATDGLPRRVQLPSGAVEVLSGVVAMPDEPFHLLP